MSMRSILDELRPSWPGSLRTLVGLTYQEALGERCIQGAAVVATGIAALSLPLSEVAIFAHERVLVDVILTAMTLAPMAITAVMAQALVGRDVGTRAAAPLLTHPLPVWVWLLGRFAGLWCAQVTQLLVMAAVLVPVLWGAGLPLTATLACSMGLIVVECTVTLSLAIATRCAARPAMAAVMALVVIGAGYLTLNPRELRDAPRAQAMPLYRVAQALLPQMQRINTRAEAATGATLPAGVVGYGVIYGLGYSAAALLVGMVVVHRRRGSSGA